MSARAETFPVEIVGMYVYTHVFAYLGTFVDLVAFRWHVRMHVSMLVGNQIEAVHCNTNLYA